MTPQQLPHQQTLTQKKRLDLRHLYYELQSLDSQNYGSWPFIVKAFLLAIVISLTALVCYLLPISNQLKQNKVEENRQQILIQTYHSSQAEASQLTTDLKQGEDTQQQLEALSYLMPSIEPSTESVSLAQQLNDLGLRSGVIIEDLQLAAVQEQDFYHEQPLTLIASGNYYHIGELLGSLSALPRLITLHDFSIKTLAAGNLQQTSSPRLALTLQAKAYHLKPTSFDEAHRGEVMPIFNTPEVLETEVVETKANPYQPKAQRSPFSLPDFIAPQSNPVTKPENSRSDAQPASPNKQQHHPLSGFQYRGRMSGIGGTYGLIQRADGVIMRVQVGQRLGQDNIKVIEITATQINFTEQIEEPEIENSENRLALIAPISPFRNDL